MSGAAKCPICGKVRQADFAPFCGRLCADVDLKRWFNADYGIPVEEPEIDPDEPGPGPVGRA